MRANPPRGGDAKPEVSNPGVSADGFGVRWLSCPLSSSIIDRRTWMSKFKFRSAQLMLSVTSLVALVVVTGASFKF
jgi:hypothetical protein